MSTATATRKIRGYLVCRRCGQREPQYTYDCDVAIVCEACDVADHWFHRFPRSAAVGETTVEVID